MFGINVPVGAVAVVAGFSGAATGRPGCRVGIALGIFTPGNNTLVMRAIPTRTAGTGGGLLNMTRSLGTALGVALVILALHLSLAGAQLLGANQAAHARHETLFVEACRVDRYGAMRFLSGLSVCRASHSKSLPRGPPVGFGVRIAHCVTKRTQRTDITGMGRRPILVITALTCIAGAGLASVEAGPNGHRPSAARQPPPRTKFPPRRQRTPQRHPAKPTTDRGQCHAAAYDAHPEQLVRRPSQPPSSPIARRSNRQKHEEYSPHRRYHR